MAVEGQRNPAPTSGQRRSQLSVPGNSNSTRTTTSRSGGETCCSIVLIIVSYIFIIVTLPFSLFLCIKVVNEYERVVIFRLGRLLTLGAAGPGIFFVIPCTDSFRKVDLRTISFDVPPQKILTKDSVTVAVDAVVYYRVSDPVKALCNVEDYGCSTGLLAATILRDVLGTKNLSDILSEREAISLVMRKNLDEATDPWGVTVERVEVSNVKLPDQLQRAMAAEAEATREARANVIAAEGEHNSARALRAAAEILTVSPAAMQLRYLQTLQTISAEKNSTIIFPLPMDMMRHLMSKWGMWVLNGTLNGRMMHVSQKMQLRIKGMQLSKFSYFSSSH